MNLIIFDCDGTLVDSQHMIVAAMSRAFTGAGMPPPGRAAILNVVGLSLAPAVAKLVSPELSSAEVRALAESYKLAFQELRCDPLHHEPLYPGAREALQALAQREGAALGIATGKSRRGVDAVLKREGLDGLFSTIQTADTHPSKPHPSMVYSALAETGAAPLTTVMIGDTTYDVEMARAAGIPAVGVAWGYHAPADLTAAGAHTVLTHYGELIDAVDAILAQRRETA